MKVFDRIALRAAAANTFSFLVREAQFVDHPVTKERVLKERPIFMNVPGAPNALFLDEPACRLYGFKGIKEFVKWLQESPVMARGAVIYSACLGDFASKMPVRSMADDDVQKELRARLMVDRDIGGTAPQRAIALRDLRVIAGEFLPDVVPEVHEPEALPGSDEPEQDAAGKALARARG